MNDLIRLIFVFILILINGFFVASEFALVAVRKTRIEELVRQKKRSAKLIQQAQSNLDTFISATQLGITIASLSLGWIGEPVMARLLLPFFSFLPATAATISSHTVAFAIGFVLITYFHITLGELVPKSIALQRGEKTSFFIILPLTLFTRVFKPFILALNYSGIVVLKLLRITPAEQHQIAYSEEEIQMILSQSQQGGIIPEEEAEMVRNVFNLGDIPVKEIMLPRTEITAFNVATTLKDIAKKIERNTHSRFPVYEHSIDTIVGFVHIKDIYKALLKLPGETKLLQTSIIRTIITVPEIKKASEVLLEMQKKSIHMAIVNDEFGGTAGLVTLEDVIESLVGEIQDEFEQPQSEIQKQSDGSYLIDGLVTITTIQHKFNIPLKGQGYTTIGGLMFGILGREPRTGDTVQIGNTSFKVEKMQGRRIKTIRVSPTAPKKKK